MIRKLTEQDRAEVLAFLDCEPEINMYIIGDIKNFGFDKEDQAIYAEFREGNYFAVLSRNLSHIVYYANSDDFNPEWVEIIKQYDFLFISGKHDLMKPIHTYFPDMIDDKLDFMKSTTFTKDNDVTEDGIETLNNALDAHRVYNLLNSIEELESVRKKTEEEFIQYLLDNSEDNGTTVFIRDGELVVASASAVFETRHTAMIVGVATDLDYREQGLGKKVMHHLVDLYVNKKKKTLCLYYDDPRAGALYEKMGFETIARWTMLLKRDA